jgi:hypothetical protein
MQRVQVMMANDEYETARGELVLAFAEAGTGVEVKRAKLDFEIPPLGQMTYVLKLESPAAVGAYLLSATATWPGRKWSPVVSRRNVIVNTQVRISRLQSIHALSGWETGLPPHPHPGQGEAPDCLVGSPSSR